MTRKIHLLRIAVVVGLLASSCSQANKDTTPVDKTPRGGTLHVVMPEGISSLTSLKPPSAALDPQTEYSYDVWEIFRCCLLRTMLSHLGKKTEEGGARLLPDLASRLPDVSDDGRTWTFELKRGIHYGPPLQTVEVTSPDFVNAMRREAKLGKDAYSFYFNVIQGFRDYATGKSDSISGLEAPNPHTLVVKLNQPAGDFGNLMTLAGTAPIPSGRDASRGPFGIATGHDDGYGSFLVSTGPYMIEGSDKLNFALKPSAQPKAEGLSSGRFLRLVRNPSWNSASDALRAGYADAIDLKVIADTPDLPTLVTKGSADLMLDIRPPQDALLKLAAKVRADPALGSVQVGQRDFVRYLAMNLAAPPFDDIAVRRAVNYALNKSKIAAAYGGPFRGSVAHHIALDSLEDNLLETYDPYHSPDDAGDIAKAKQEMSRSRYDANHDGICDHAACHNIVGVSFDLPLFAPLAAEIVTDLKRIGLDVRVLPIKPAGIFAAISNPRNKYPLTLTIAWGKDLLNASNYFAPLFSRASVANNNLTLLGASPSQLRSWGYSVTTVPDVDDRIAQCQALTGSAQLQCWASLDQFLMEEVVPWAPYLFEARPIIMSKRVAAFSFDQFANQPALDRIALKP